MSSRELIEHMIESKDLMLDVHNGVAAASVRNGSGKGIGMLSGGGDVAAELETRKCGGSQP